MRCGNVVLARLGRGGACHLQRLPVLRLARQRTLDDLPRAARQAPALRKRQRFSVLAPQRSVGGGLRVRSGDYRILYQVFDRKLLVLVVRIGHRSEVYREAALRRARRGAP